MGENKRSLARRRLLVLHDGVHQRDDSANQHCQPGQQKHDPHRDEDGDNAVVVLFPHAAEWHRRETRRLRDERGAVQLTALGLERVPVVLPVRRQREGQAGDDEVEPAEHEADPLENRLAEPEIGVKAGEHSEQSGQEGREDETKHPYRPGAVLDGRMKIRDFRILGVLRTSPACRTVCILFEG
eukprot:CAMPEP_0172207838 /NCGR_PEP_ID=MMETSP1050-20130122/34092_1 /TAXON_ID=233186 /ORGANISM="Cryptomonas curvata, Strain CCAP979/52" /LENGTH=183 /DNA_ID=CAMNT_0012887269 /DNA_START=331 /DNA_END=882 /DNA_ORIENTATION=+